MRKLYPGHKTTLLAGDRVYLPAVKDDFTRELSRWGNRVGQMGRYSRTGRLLGDATGSGAFVAGLVAEVPDAGEDHGHAEPVGCGNHVLVLD